MGKNSTAGYSTSAGERRSYAIFFLGQNLIWGFIGYISTFLTDIGISAAKAAASRPSWCCQRKAVAMPPASKITTRQKNVTIRLIFVERLIFIFMSKSLNDRIYQGCGVMGVTTPKR